MTRRQLESRVDGAAAADFAARSRSECPSCGAAQSYAEFKAGCDAGQVDLCTSLGEWWAHMRGDHARAVDFFGPACLKHRHATACLNLGRTLGAWCGWAGGVERTWRKAGVTKRRAVPSRLQARRLGGTEAVLCDAVRGYRGCPLRRCPLRP